MAARLLNTPSFSQMFRTWKFAVRSVLPSIAPTSNAVFPATVHLRTSSYLGVSFGKSADLE
jgi:hypothetical protein